MTLKSWKTLGSRHVVRDRWITLRADRCETAAGVILDPYYVQEPADWIQVVAFDAQDRILITHQYRHGAGAVCMELPCGTVEPGETPMQAATRELLEETGCTVEHLHSLPPMSPNPARYTSKVHAFVGTGARITQPQQLDQTEEIEFEFLPIHAVLSSIDAGVFPQALHVGSVLLALRLRGLMVLK